LLLCVLTAVAVYIFIVSSNTVKAPDTGSEELVAIDESIAEDLLTTSVETGPRQFTDNEFKIFFNNLLQPNTLRVVNPPQITDDILADEYIRKVAEDRGYRLRSVVDNTQLLLQVDTELGAASAQPRAADAWVQLEASLAKEGIDMRLTSVYRSVSEQLDVFINQLAFEGVNITQITNGSQDDKLEKVLATAAPPGYSKHHSGYGFDFFCPGFEFRNFKNSTCHEFLVADNYQAAKEYGFIPSYPSETDLQGPDPEAWEYIWVGSERLIN